MRNKPKKKIFFFSFAPISPVFETELDIINNFLANGDFVYLVDCIGKVESTYWNIFNSSTYNDVLKSKVKIGLNLLRNKKNLKIIQLKNSKEIQKINPPNIKKISDIIKFKHDNVLLGYGIASSVQTLFKDHNPNLKKNIVNKLYKKCFKTSISMYQSLKEIFKEIEPDKVYIFNGRIAESWPIVCLSKKLKIDYFTYEVAQVKKGFYRIIKNQLPHLKFLNLKKTKNPKKNLKINTNEITKFIFKNKVTMKNLNFKVYANKFEKKKLPKKFNKNVKNICIFNSSIEESHSIKGLKVNIYKDSNNAIFKIVNNFKNREDIFFYLRVHPNIGKTGPASIDFSSQLKEIISNCKKIKNLKIIWPEEKIDSYELLKNCEKVISFGSTIGFEASYLGKPVISINNKKGHKLNYAYFPKNHRHCLNLITKKLKPKPQIGSIEFFNYLLNSGVKYKNVSVKNNNYYFKKKKIAPNNFLINKHKILNFILHLFKFEYNFLYKIKQNYLFKKLFIYY